MKIFNKLSVALLSAIAFISCEKTYDAPPLNEPTYTGAAANVTISELKTKYPATTDNALTITEDLILKAYVSGNDESGNIYKSLYIQDATSGLQVQVDGNNLYNTYRVGQEVYINLKGLSMSVYGGEFQLGYPTGTNYRIPTDIFSSVVSLNGWAKESNVTPIEVSDISSLNANIDAYKFMLVKFTGVRFENGGKATYAVTNVTTNQNLTDANGNSIIVRTSGYADFISETLPKGKGEVTGILGRFNGAWQLTLRTIRDVANFDGTDAPSANDTTSTAGVIFNETFGTPVKEGNNWPLFSAYKGFDNDTTMFETVSGSPSVRVVGNRTNVWMPTKVDQAIRIKNIKSTVASATLELNLGANVYKAGESQDLAKLSVSVNGTSYTLSSKVVTGDNKEGNTPFTLTIENVVLSTTSTNTIDLAIATADNAFGYRIYSVKLFDPNSAGSTTGGSTITPSGKL